MAGIFSIFQGVLNSKYTDIYLDALDKHIGFNEQLGPGENVVVQAINSLLARQDSRHLGLRIFAKFLDHCTPEVLERRAVLWMSLAVKALNPIEMQLYCELAFGVVGTLVEALTSSDLKKNFATNHLPKVYEVLCHVPDEGRAQIKALRCTEICLRNFSGPSAPFRSVVERFLARFIDSESNAVSRGCGKCHNALLLVRGANTHGLSQKMQWQNYQIQLLGSMQSIFNLLFANCTEIYDGTIEKMQMNLLATDVRNDPIERMAQLAIRFENFAVYLTEALREPFPVEKPIFPKKFLYLIRRGMSVKLTDLENKGTTDNLALGIILPKVQSNLLDILRALIQTIGSHLKINYDDILDLLVEIIKGTSTGRGKLLLKLRIQAYEVITLWCKTMRNGSSIETVGEILINEIFNDITPIQNECVLQMLAGSRKQLSKKARRQLHKTLNEQTKVVQNYANNSDGTIENKSFVQKNLQMLSMAATRCLAELLLSSASYLKSAIIKATELRILQICTLFYEVPLHPHYLYNDPVCRLEIYNVLYILIMAVHSGSPPAMQTGLLVFKTACVTDKSEQVRSRCFEILRILEKLIHPQKEGLLFCIEERQIRTAFIEQESEILLRNFVSNDCSSNNRDVREEQTKTYDMSTIMKISTQETGVETYVEQTLDVSQSLCENTAKAEGGENCFENSNQRALANEDTDSEATKCPDLHCNNYNKEHLVSFEIIRGNEETVSKVEKEVASKADDDDDVLMGDIEACFVNELN